MNLVNVRNHSEWPLMNMQMIGCSFHGEIGNGVDIASVDVSESLSEPMAAHHNLK